MGFHKLKSLLNLGVLLSVIGFILLFFSVNFGIKLAEMWLIEQGGIVDSSNYDLRVKGKTNSFLAVGSILFGIGLTTTIIAYYKMLNIKETE